jgi:hypothetical protein
MESETGGWLWFVIDVLFVAALGVAIAYGTIAYRRARIRRQNERIAQEGRPADQRAEPAARR